MWESPHLAIYKGCGKRGREDSFIVLPSTLSIRPSFPPLCFLKTVEQTFFTISQVLRIQLIPQPEVFLCVTLVYP